GTRRGKIWRIWSIAWFNLSHQWNRSRMVKIWLSFIAFILILSNLMLFIGPSYLLPTGSPNEILEDHLWGTIRKFVRFQVLIATPDEIDPVFDTGYSIFMLIGLIMIGAGLISDDKKYKVLDIYDSKIDRKSYLTGKYGTLILFGNLLFTLPCILEWVLLIVGVEGIDLLAAIPVLIGVILFTEILILVLVSFVLTFSSLTNNRLYSGVLAFAFFLSISKVISGFIGVTDTFTPLMYLDFFTVLSVLSFLIQGEKSVVYYDSTGGIDFNLLLDLTGQAGVLLLPFLGFFICLSLLICYYQVVWKHQHSIMPFKRGILP
ncbi:MAG: hypothetical protein ACW964_12355, partial [Candidatus Hodarchaeales archaeon]